jgi:hypothetical protein
LKGSLPVNSIALKGIVLGQTRMCLPIDRLQKPT